MHEHPGTPVRRHARRPAHFSLRGVSVDDGFHAVAQDISEEGMAFQASLGFQPGDRLQILVPLPQSTESIRVLCEVRHSQGPGLTGVKFLQVSEAERSKVLQMLAPDVPEQQNERKTGT